MCDCEKNSIEVLMRASELLPEIQRQRILGIEEGVAIAVSSMQQPNAEQK